MGTCLCIAVVDDNLDFLQSLAKILEILGHQPHTFDSAEKALRALDDICPDVILADLAMPDMDGFELARQIRGRPGHERVVLAAITGYSDEEHTREVIRSGFDYRFVKPMAPGELQEFLEQVSTNRARSA